MIKLLILITGCLSFLNFAFPSVLANIKPQGDVLGVARIETVVNYSTVKTALEIYCLNKSSLPVNLNKLYGDELSTKWHIDLNTYYKVENSGNCNFKLIAKS